MFVRDRMTANPVTVTPDTPFDHALRLMQERQVRRFPVVDRQGLVIGIVSEKDVLNTAPSKATMLDRHELHALLAQLQVSNVMTRSPIMVDPGLPLEEAARIMADNKIGGLPVVDATKTLVGIITETDIFRTMVELMGARRSGLRLTIRVEDHRGALAELTSAIAQQGGNILTLGVFQGEDQTHPVITTKVQDVEEASLVDALRAAGMELIDVRKV